MSASCGATLVYAWGRGRNARSFLLRWCRWATSASDALADPWRAAAPKHRARKLNDVESDTPIACACPFTAASSTMSSSGSRSVGRHKNARRTGVQTVATASTAIRDTAHATGGAVAQSCSFASREQLSEDATASAGFRTYAGSTGPTIALFGCGYRGVAISDYAPELGNSLSMISFTSETYCFWLCEVRTFASLAGLARDTSAHSGY